MIHYNNIMCFNTLQGHTLKRNWPRLCCVFTKRYKEVNSFHSLRRYESSGSLSHFLYASGTQQLSTSPRLRHRKASLQSAPVFIA